MPTPEALAAAHAEYNNVYQCVDPPLVERVAASLDAFAAAQVAKVYEYYQKDHLDLVKVMYAEREKKISEAIAEERGRCREIVVQMRNQRQAYRQIIENPKAQLPQYKHWAQDAIDDVISEARVAKAVAEARQHGCHYAEGTCDECYEIACAAVRVMEQR
jgi:hypothetical protein